jgi:hypothetical protein
MPYVSQVAVGKLPYLRVFGNNYPTVDGTGVRDYTGCAKSPVKLSFFAFYMKQFNI